MLLRVCTSHCIECIFHTNGSSGFRRAQLMTEQFVSASESTWRWNVVSPLVLLEEVWKIIVTTREFHVGLTPAYITPF